MIMENKHIDSVLVARTAKPYKYECIEKLKKQNAELKSQIKELLSLNKEWKKVYIQEKIDKKLQVKELKKQLDINRDRIIDRLMEVKHELPVKFQPLINEIADEIIGGKDE
jgi:hypothetical protein